jgi:hypothetical protein
MTGVFFGLDDFLLCSVLAVIFANFRGLLDYLLLLSSSWMPKND